MIKLIINSDVRVYRHINGINTTPILAFIQEETSMSFMKIKLENGKVYDIVINDNKLETKEDTDALRNEKETQT